MCGCIHACIMYKSFHTSCTCINSSASLVSICTCQVDRLGEDVFLRAACLVVFLYEVGVTGCISQSGGCQQHVDTQAEHVFEIVCNQPADLLSLYKVALVVPGKMKLRKLSVSSCRFRKYYSSSRFFHKRQFGKLPNVLYKKVKEKRWRTVSLTLVCS